MKVKNNNKKCSIPNQKGFTLIELMLVVAILATLAAFAIPAYTQYQIKGWRAEGRLALHNLLLQQESIINQTGSYQTFAAGSSSTFKAFSGENSSSSAYLLGARACPGKTLRECVLLFAVPTSGKSDPVITELTLNSAGVKSCSSSDTSVCWP